MAENNGTPDATGAQSVDRAITVLEIISRLGEATVSEVASEVGVHRSTISRLLAVLETRGMVEVAGSRGRYRLGLGLLRMAQSVRSELSVATVGADLSRELAAHVGETVNIAVLQGDSAVNVQQSEGAGTITANSWVGRPTPLHATSSGKVLLAGLSPDDQAAQLARPLPGYTAATLTDPERLRAELVRARTDGFALTIGELEEGLNAIAVPVHGHNGTVIAALSASGPSYRFTPEVMRAQLDALRITSAALGARMGHLPR
jgi:IclR family acetate operon transcriptional repressor